MRVLHAPINIAGQPYTIVKALRRHGVDATMMIFRERPFKRGSDTNLDLERLKFPPLMWARLVVNLLQVARQYDVFHLHGGRTLLYPVRLDLPILKALGKKIVLQFWGSDIRGKGQEELGYLKYADAIVVGSYHQLEFAPQGSDVVLVGLDLEEWRPTQTAERKDNTVRILHAPSSRRVKGTAHVLAALEALQSRGLGIEKLLVEGVPHDEARQMYQQADIVVDQLGTGWYGVFAVETMAMGKPVLGYIDPIRADLLKQALGTSVPILSVTPQTLADELAVLAQDAQKRCSLGRLCRRYVEQVHDIQDKATQITAIYQRICPR